MAKNAPDLSEFERLSHPRNPPCAMGLILTGELTPQLDDDDLVKLEAAMAKDQGVITNAAIAKWLAQRGHDLHSQRVMTHRKGTCCCGKG